MKIKIDLFSLHVAFKDGHISKAGVGGNMKPTAS